MLVAVVLEGDDQIEWTAGYLARSGGDHIRVILSFRNANRPLVWMGRKIFDEARSIIRTQHHFVNWDDGINLLIIPVAA